MQLKSTDYLMFIFFKKPKSLPKRKAYPQKDDFSYQ